MYVRLAFATAVNTDPEILIVDEALAVGDIRFQRKCFRRFQEMQKAGKTILFVTHSVDLVQTHCSRAIYLNSGEVRSKGEPKVVIQDYLEDLFGSETSDESGDASPREQEWSSKIVRSAPGQDLPRDLCPSRPLYNPNEYRWGDQRAVIFDYAFGSVDGPIRGGFERGQRISLDVSIYLTETIDDLIIGFTVKTVDGRTVFGANTRERGIELPSLSAGDHLPIQFCFVCALIPGEYFLSIGIAQDDQSRDNIAVDRRYDLIHMPVRGASGDFGVADLDLSIGFSKHG